MQIIYVHNHLPLSVTVPYKLTLKDLFTLEVFEAFSVGISESPHGAIMKLLKKSHVLCSIKEPLTGRAHKEHFRFSLWLILYTNL